MPKKILLVEDSSVDALIIRKLLLNQKPNLNIVHIENGESALGHLREKSTRPNLIILDMNMPGLDGVELVFCLKEIGSKSQEIPIVVVSSHFAPGEKEECEKKGVSLCLEKPFSSDSAKLVLNLLKSAVASN